MLLMGTEEPIRNHFHILVAAPQLPCYYLNCDIFFFNYRTILFQVEIFVLVAFMWTKRSEHNILVIVFVYICGILI